MAIQDRLEILQTDAHGGSGSTGLYILGGAGADWEADASAVLDSLGPLTEASVTPKLTLRAGAVSILTAGAYDTASDKAVFVFVDSEGTEMRVEVPAPKDSCFLADDETVDELDALVAEFIAQVIAFCATKAQVAIIAFLRGWRKRARRSR